MANGSCKRRTEKVAANGDVSSVACPHAKNQSAAAAYANDEQAPPAAAAVPLRVVSDHVQFLITEKQRPRDSSERNADTETSAGEDGQRKTNLNDVSGEEKEDWATGK